MTKRIENLPCRYLGDISISFNREEHAVALLPVHNHVQVVCALRQSRDRELDACRLRLTNLGLLCADIDSGLRPDAYEVRSEDHGQGTGLRAYLE